MLSRILFFQSFIFFMYWLEGFARCFAPGFVLRKRKNEKNNFFMIPHHDFQIAKKLSYFFSKISGLFGYSLAQSTESKNFAKIFWFTAFRWNFPVLRNFSHSESNNTSNKYLSPSNWFISLLNRLFIIFVFFSYSFLLNTIN